MKTHSLILAALLLATAGCAGHRPDGHYSGTLNEPAGAQSQSSDVNPASSSRNVGQSGATTNRFDTAPGNLPP